MERHENINIDIEKADDIRCAMELCYPNIVLQMLSDEDNPNKRQRILIDARNGVYDIYNTSSNVPTYEPQATCGNCLHFINKPNRRKGDCSMKYKKITYKRTDACKLFVKKEV